MFDEKIKRALNYYVYMLVDPRNNSPFYIGKGKNNRVFDHLNQAIKNEDPDNLKYEIIRTIVKAGKEPGHIIIRHGLTEETAYHVECALLDYARYGKHNLAVLTSGHDSVELGLMTDAEIAARYKAKKLSRIPNDCVIFNINKSYQRNDTPNAIYQATKESWRMADPSGRISTVLSMYHGLIVEVFTVEKWYKQEREYGPNAERPGETYYGWGFNGHIANTETRDRYIHKAVVRPKGASNVVIYNLPE